MTAKMSRLGAALLVAAALAGVGAPATAQWGGTRFDNWLYYQENFGDTARWQYRPRLFIPYKFGNGWTFTQRIDAPMYYTDAQGPDNTTGGWKFGLSDIFVEEIFDTPDVAKNFRLRSSLRLVFPTGGEGPFGADQWQAALGFGGNWRLPEVGKGMAFAPYARYFYGFEPGSDSVTTRRRWDFFPELSFTMTEKWSLVFWPEQGISYNLRSHKWFVPLEAMVTHRLDKQWEYSVGGAYPMNDDDRSYRWVVQGRLRYYY